MLQQVYKRIFFVPFPAFCGHFPVSLTNPRSNSLSRWQAKVQ
jgi:hypothetical protein